MKILNSSTRKIFKVNVIDDGLVKDKKFIGSMSIQGLGL